MEQGPSPSFKTLPPRWGLKAARSTAGPQAPAKEAGGRRAGIPEENTLALRNLGLVCHQATNEGVVSLKVTGGLFRNVLRRRSHSKILLIATSQTIFAKYTFCVFLLSLGGADENLLIDSRKPRITNPNNVPTSG